MEQVQGADVNTKFQVVTNLLSKFSKGKNKGGMLPGILGGLNGGLGMLSGGLGKAGKAFTIVRKIISMIAIICWMTLAVVAMTAVNCYS